MTTLADPRTTVSTLVLHRLRKLHGATIVALHCRPPDRHATDSAGIHPYGAEIIDHLRSEGLLGHVLWSTECRPEDVDVKAFRSLTAAGLFLVRLDLGSPDGISAPQSAVRAVQVLRGEGVLVEYDFELFGPLPRFGTVRHNVGFLRSVVCDGSTPAVFSLPDEPDASYSPWLASYHRRLRPGVEPWLGDDGLSAQLQEAWAELVVAERLLRGLSSVAAHRIALQRATMRSNTSLLALVGDSAREFELYGETRLLDADAVETRTEGLRRLVADLRGAFVDANAGALIAGPWVKD